MAQMLAFEHHTGQGPCIALVHGFPVDRVMWRATIQALRKAGREVLAIDLRGFGHSPAPSQEDEASIKALSDDLVPVLDTLSIGTTVIAGFSMGGYVALRFALDHAERLLGLVLVDTRAGADDEAARAGRAKTAADVQANGVQGLAEAMLPKQLTAASLEKPVAKRLREMILRQSPEGVAHALHAMAGRSDATPHLASIEVPTLIIVGSEDQLTPPPHSEAMRDAMPHATLVQVPAAGHMVPLEQPEAFHQVLLEWLAGLP